MHNHYDKDGIAQRLQEEFELYLDAVRRDSRFKGHSKHRKSGAAFAFFLNLDPEGPHILPATAQSWLSARHVPDGENLEKVLRRLNLNKDYLLFKKGPRWPEEAVHELSQASPDYANSAQSVETTSIGSTFPVHLREPIENLSKSFETLVESLNAHFGVPPNKKRPD
jgi:hypothetical protein